MVNSISKKTLLIICTYITMKKKKKSESNLVFLPKTPTEISLCLYTSQLYDLTLIPPVSACQKTKLKIFFLLSINHNKEKTKSGRFWHNHYDRILSSTVNVTFRQSGNLMFRTSNSWNREFDLERHWDWKCIIKDPMLLYLS